MPIVIAVEDNISSLICVLLYILIFPGEGSRGQRFLCPPKSPTVHVMPPNKRQIDCRPPSCKSSPQLQPSSNHAFLLRYNYLQFRAIIFHSAHVLFAFLLPPPGTRSHRMSVNVHLLRAFETTSKVEPPQNTLFQFCFLRRLTPNPHGPNLIRRFINHLLTHCLLTYNKNSASAEVADRNVTWYVL